MSRDDGLKAAQEYIAGLGDDDLRDYGERYLHWMRSEYGKPPARGKVGWLRALRVRTEIRERLRG